MLQNNQDEYIEEGQVAMDYEDMGARERPKEGHMRSLYKAVSWRFVATTTTVIISYFVTGDVTSALEIGAIEFFVKIGVYYGHERLWLCCDI